MILLMPFLRLAFEIALLVVILKAGIRELSSLAIFLIVLRLSVSFITRIFQIPDLLDDLDHILSGVITCILKIVLEVGILFAIKEDIDISMDFAIVILIFMSLRNISDTWSLLAIGVDE